MIPSPQTQLGKQHVFWVSGAKFIFFYAVCFSDFLKWASLPGGPAGEAAEEPVHQKGLKVPCIPGLGMVPRRALIRDGSNTGLTLLPQACVEGSQGLRSSRELSYFYVTLK